MCRQIAPRGNVVGKTGWNKHKQRLRGKESEYRRPAPSNSTYIYIIYIYIYIYIYVYKLLHSLMPGNAPFRSTVCMHVWVIWDFTQTQSVSHAWECISCVYNTCTWVECMHIKIGNGRESTQRERAENEAPDQILGCDGFHNTVRNSR